MASKVPAVLKPITPYVLRGQELIKANGDKVVAFNCFKHAMDMGIKLNDKSPEVQGFLLELMNELESLKPSTQGKSQEDMKQICENFANGVFQRADTIDKGGNADKGTAQSFYAAASFFEILKQFSPDKELDPDIKQLAVYAKWRATQIIKAIKEGRKPDPPSSSFDIGGGEDHHDQDHDDHPPQAPTIPVARPPAPGTVTSVPAPTVTRTPESYGTPLSSLPKAKKAVCLEIIRFARAALEADDIQAAVDRLQSALAILHGN